MRVLIATISAYGHLQPLLPLAQALVDAGHEVAIASGPDMCLRAEAAGFATFNAGITADVAFGQLAARFPDQEYNRLEPSEILDWYVPHLFGEVMAPIMLGDLEPLVRKWRPDVILHDIWEFAAPIAAASAGIPSVSQTLGLRFDDRILDAVAALSPHCGGSAALSLTRRRVFIAIFAWISRHPAYSPTIQRVTAGTMHPLRPIAQPPVPGEELPQWIESRRDVPLVHTTLGTNISTNTDISMFRSVIEGLGDLDIDVLITIGFDKYPASIGPLASNMHVENYVPQSLLLPHCSAVICHGGAGSTLSCVGARLAAVDPPSRG